MNKDNAHLYLPLVAALAAGKTIQQTGPDVKGRWFDSPSPTLILPPDSYRIKPEFIPPAELFVLEASGVPLSGYYTTTGEAVMASLSAGITFSNVIRFRLDDRYTHPDPVSGFVNLYPRGPDEIHPSLPAADSVAGWDRTRVAKVTEVPPRIVYLHHDERAGETVRRSTKDYLSRFTICHQYVECWD